MALSISAAVLLDSIVFVLVKGGYVRVGFTLAVTGLAPTINSGLVSLAGPSI
ncbi:hypothetical protein [Streptomyces flaveolus]|uniref:hypothetical protein n=1 Tax=Streptomyces flaveolus TaxID=67297 RepID=UPI00380BCAB8